MPQQAAARTTASSLKAIRSSRLPPPRATISTSGRGTPSRGRAQNPAMAAAMRSAAPSPCTGTGHSRMVRPNRRATVVWMSCSTAPCAEVTTPITPGRNGSARRRSNSPSAASRTRSASMRASIAPAPAYSSVSMMSWYWLLSPQAEMRPVAITSIPSSGFSPTLRAAVFQTMPRRLAPSSFRQR